MRIADRSRYPHPPARSIAPTHRQRQVDIKTGGNCSAPIPTGEGVTPAAHRPGVGLPDRPGEGIARPGARPAAAIHRPPVNRIAVLRLRRGEGNCRQHGDEHDRDPQTGGFSSRASRGITRRGENRSRLIARAFQLQRRAAGCLRRQAVERIQTGFSAQPVALRVEIAPDLGAASWQPPPAAGCPGHTGHGARRSPARRL